MNNAPIALLTDRRYAGPAVPGDWYHENILRDDALLRDALRMHGLDSVRLAWDDPSADWSSFQALVFRTTWDYYERFEEFMAWFDQVRTFVRLVNNPQALSWNMHKRYLLELQQKGVSVVPTLMLDRGTEPDWHGLLEENNWSQAVVKPAVSGGARLTYRLSHDNVDEISRLVGQHLTREDFLVQPFMADIQRTGEDTLMVLGGTYTHAVRKMAKKGDFRVQDDYGGTVASLEPTDEQRALALRAMQASGFDLVYGRVDVVADEQGEPLVMELEIIEPELWLRYHPPAAQPFAQAIAREVELGQTADRTSYEAEWKRDGPEPDPQG